MARADFAQAQADRSATANATRRIDRARAPRSRRRRTAHGRSPRRPSGRAHGCRRHWCREFASVKMPSGSIRCHAAGPSYPAIAAEANRQNAVTASFGRARGERIWQCPKTASGIFAGAEFAGSVRFRTLAAAVLQAIADGLQSPALFNGLIDLATGARDDGRSRATGVNDGIGGAAGQRPPMRPAALGASRSPAATLRRRQEIACRATSSPLSKSATLSHSLARRLSISASSHSCGDLDVEVALQLLIDQLHPVAGDRPLPADPVDVAMQRHFTRFAICRARSP